MDFNFSERLLKENTGSEVSVVGSARGAGDWDGHNLFQFQIHDVWDAWKTFKYVPVCQVVLFRLCSVPGLVKESSKSSQVPV